MLSPRLETERLVLRRYEEADIDMQYKIITDNRLSKYIKFPNLTKEEELEYIKDCIKNADDSKYEKWVCGLSRVMEKAGFKKDGHIANRRLNKDGTYSGVEYYSKTKK